MQQAVLRGEKTRETPKISYIRLSFFVLAAFLLVAGLSACSSGAGIFAGGGWQAGALAHQQIRTLAVDTNNSQAIYAGDVAGKIFASSDGGQHWAEHSDGLPGGYSINALSFDASGKKLYAATGNGLYVSIDAARHWSVVDKNAAALSPDDYTALAFDLTAQHTIYLGTQHHAVLLSINDGKTWSALSNGFPGAAVINSLAFDSDNHQLWAATSRGIYRFDSRDTTWQAFNNGLPVHILVYTVQPALVSGGAPGLIFAGTNHGFYRSQDSGAHWTQSQESLSRTDVRAIYIDFRKPTTIYVGIDAGALRSDDSGQSWGGIAPGLPRSQPVYALTLGATGYTQLFAAGNGVYLYPGSNNGFDITRLFPLLLIVLFFYLLYRLTRRNIRSRQAILKPERISRQTGPDQLSANETSEPGNLT